MDQCFDDANANAKSPGYGVKLIRCCLDYDINLLWRQQRNDIVSLAATFAATVDFLCLVVPDLLCS